jgi:glycosyltransferase involved in cell wall biosynthesis
LLRAGRTLRQAGPISGGRATATTWPHKNHLGLLDALAILRDEYGVVVPLVASGGTSRFFRTIEARIAALSLERQVQLLGYVDPIALQSLYRLCRLVVFPTKFEGWGMPVCEAFAAGVPLACSAVTSLPHLVGDAALLFDPDDPRDIAVVLLRAWRDDRLRRDLVKKGKANVARFSWEKTARLFRAHYRSVGGGVPLTPQDRELLAQDPLV